MDKLWNLFNLWTDFLLFLLILNTHKILYKICLTFKINYLCSNKKLNILYMYIIYVFHRRRQNLCNGYFTGGDRILLNMLWSLNCCNCIFSCTSWPLTMLATVALDLMRTVTTPHPTVMPTWVGAVGRCMCGAVTVLTSWLRGVRRRSPPPSTRPSSRIVNR